MVATEIKAPACSVYRKYVYTYFMVKMRIDFGSLGSFASIVVVDNAPGRILVCLKFFSCVWRCLCMGVLLCEVLVGQMGGQFQSQICEAKLTSTDDKL